MYEPDDLDRIRKIDEKTERAMAATGLLLLLWLAGMILALAWGGQQ